VHPFSYAPSAPFTRGARRVIDLRAVPGGAVRAPCAGRVTYAGALPGRASAGTRGITIRCGRLRATVLGLRATAVRRGTRVRAGAWLGAAAGAILRLGARRATDRFGYVDPLTLLGPQTPAAPPGAAPLGRAPRPAPPARPPAPAPPQAAARHQRHTQPHTAPPAIAYAAIALLAAATGTGELARRRRRARHEGPLPDRVASPG
jgi:hypothetical protein